MKTYKLKRLHRQLERANNYEEWKELAIALDQLSGDEAWKEQESSNMYDYAEIKLRLDTLRTFRHNGDDEGLLFTLNEGIHGNMGGMGKAHLYNRALFGTKQLIVDYVEEVAASLLHLADFNNKSIPLKDKVDFFSRASICFGRSALMLSGGGQLGNFHIGVLKALAQQSLLPNVISGASAGSIFAALAGTLTDNELANFLEKKKILELINEQIELYDNVFKDNRINEVDLERIVNRLIPDVTFQEAFKRTGRKINISIAPRESHQKSRLLNAIASPNVLLRSAVMASCAIPGVMPPVMLTAKNRDGETQPYLPSRKWVDGSMSNDLPSKRLTRLYGVNHFIVSLTNPLVLPFVSDPSSQNPLFVPARRLGTTILKETTQFNYSMAKKVFKFLPKSMAFTANALNSVVQQEYTGDINILADFSILKARQLLSDHSVEGLNIMIEKGEKATWPKIETIRITTKIGRVLDQIIENYREVILDKEPLG